MHWDPVDGSRQNTFVYISIRVTHYYAKGDSGQRQDSELGKLIAESCSDVIESRGRAKNGKTTCFARLLPLFVDVPHTNMNGYVEHLILNVVGSKRTLSVNSIQIVEMPFPDYIVVAVASEGGVELKWD